MIVIKDMVDKINEEYGAHFQRVTVIRECGKLGITPVTVSGGNGGRKALAITKEEAERVWHNLKCRIPVDANLAQNTLKELLTYKTEQAVADSVGLDNTTISKMAKGTRNINLGQHEAFKALLVIEKDIE